MAKQNDDDNPTSTNDSDEHEEPQSPPSAEDLIARQSGELETLQRFLDNAFASELPATPTNTATDENSPEAMTEGVSDPSARAQIRARQYALNTSRARIEKRREELHRKAEVTKYGPRGEKNSAVIVQRVEWISLDHILDDPDFTNTRLKAKDDEMYELSESMRHEGLKVPITVIAIAEGSNEFYLRAGFRRTTVARKLGWKRIPAVVLPYNTPTIEEYWTNIIENSARSKLHSYEIACAARTMRDRFRISPLDFAIRAGYSESYVHNLLRSLDRLPEDVLEAWRTSAPIPIDYYIKWAILEPAEASKMMLSYAGRNPQVVGDWQPSSKRQRRPLITMATTRGLQRMQRVRFAVEVARQLDTPTQALCLRLIDFCSGARDDVPGIYDPKKKQRRYVPRNPKPLPEPEIGELPPAPKFESDDEDDNDDKDKS